MASETNTAGRAKPEDSLTLMERAAQMLAEATTLQRAKDLRNKALTAKDWARRMGWGKEAINHARKYVILATDRIGELLAGTDRAKGAAGPGRGKAGHAAGPAFNDAPTLAEHGLTKQESAEAQFIHALPDKIKEALIAGKVTIREAHRQAKRQQHRLFPA